MASWLFSVYPLPTKMIPFGQSGLHVRFTHFVETLSPLYEAKVGRSLSMHSGINTGLAVTADMDPEKEPMV